MSNLLSTFAPIRCEGRLRFGIDRMNSSLLSTCTAIADEYETRTGKRARSEAEQTTC